MGIEVNTNVFTEETAVPFSEGKVKKLVERAWTKNGSKLSSEKLVRMAQRIRTLRSAEPWRSFRDTRTEVLNGAHLAVNDPDRKPYSDALGFLIPANEKKITPLNEKERELAQQYFAWYYKRKNTEILSDAQGDPFSTKNVTDTADLYLAEHRSLQKLLDVDRLRNIINRYRAAKAGKTNSETVRTLKKKVPLLAKVRPPRVSLEDKAEIKARNKAKEAASKIERERKQKARTEFLSRQTSLI